MSPFAREVLVAAAPVAFGYVVGLLTYHLYRLFREPPPRRPTVETQFLTTHDIEHLMLGGHCESEDGQYRVMMETDCRQLCGIREPADDRDAA